MTQNTELLPCPFCGAPAHSYAIEPHTHSSPLKALGIPDHGGSYVIEGNCQCGCGLIGETREEVTARWNRRAPAAPQPPEARKPLTDEQIEQATGAKRGTPLFLVAIGFARAIESAHGITK